MFHPLFVVASRAQEVCKRCATQDNTLRCGNTEALKGVREAGAQGSPLRSEDTEVLKGWQYPRAEGSPLRSEDTEVLDANVVPVLLIDVVIVICLSSSSGAWR